MDLLHNLALGFSVLADPMTIVYSLIGVVCGVIIGALPGLGPSVGIAVLLPMCYGLDPACALCMLCGIYYGAMYGGSITSILINTPGDSAAIMTTLDGYPMARQGKQGRPWACPVWHRSSAGRYLWCCSCLWHLWYPILLQSSGRPNISP